MAQAGSEHLNKKERRVYRLQKGGVAQATRIRWAGAHDRSIAPLSTIARLPRSARSLDCLARQVASAVPATYSLA
jgi:hypothetical protein